jgi:shikimate kinase
MITNLPPLVVMGVSGCGKSTVGALLGERLGVPFFDGDDFHARTHARQPPGFAACDAGAAGNR